MRYLYIFTLISSALVRYQQGRYVVAYTAFMFFKKGYILQSLPQLKQYIKINGHLPGEPSSNAIEKDGMDAGKMSVIMLQKTEEWTLHLIQLDERLRKLESKKNSDHD